MPLFADLFQTAILIICLIGLGLTARRLLPEVPFSLHFCFAPVAFAASLFFLEHFIPLGQLPWLWIPGLLISVWLMRDVGWKLLMEPVLWYFLFGFAYCFLWRYSYPDIYPFSDRMNDHVQLMSYSAGGQLPAEDLWMKGAKSNTYYIFQYYAAGLIHRFIGCGPGLTFHLGYCAIAGITTAAIGCALQLVTKSIRAGWFGSLYLLFGGSGATLVTPFMESPYAPSPQAAERFIGSYAMPAVPEYKTDFAVWLLHVIGISNVDAPMAYFSYSIYIGDYHPLLSCYFFLALSLLAIAAAEVAPPGGVMDKFCVAAAVSTPAFMLISTTWTAPLQGVLIIGWLIYRRFKANPADQQFLFRAGINSIVQGILIIGRLIHGWVKEGKDRRQFLFRTGFASIIQGILIIGRVIYRWLNGRNDSLQFLFLSGLVAMVVIFPYFSQFAYQTGGYGAQFQMVPIRPPLLNWLLVMLPGCVAWLGCFWTARSLPLARLFLVVGLLVMDGTYFFEMHGFYGGSFELYDTTMKWWPWVFTFLTMMGLICIWPHRILRTFVVIFFTLTIAANSYILGAYWWYIPHDHQGRLDGYAWFTEDKNQNAIYEQLLTLPKGVVLESAPPNSDAAAITLAQFTGHYSLGGWPWFELFWRGNREDINEIEINRDKFYSGTLPNPTSWLRGIIPGGVTYIVWLDRDNKRGPQMWAQVNDQIKDVYDWRDTAEDGDSHWGIWIAKPTKRLGN